MEIHPQYFLHPHLTGPFDIALIRLAPRALNIPFACLPPPGTPVPELAVCGIAGKYGTPYIIKN